VDSHHFLQVAVVFLLATVIAVPLTKRFRLGSVLGYLLAGMAIGPQALRLVSDTGGIATISEFGVVLMLFVIGLELSPQRLWVMRRQVFGTGLLQVLATSAVIGVIAWQLLGMLPGAAMIVGGSLALSSTAFGLQILGERKEAGTAYGRQAFAILLFQDLAAIPLIAAVPLLASGADTHGFDLVGALRTVGVIVAVIVGGRYLLRPVFRFVAKADAVEVSTATALLVVMGVALLMEVAGVSVTLGAFLAGVLLADSEYRHELESNIEPFKGLLLGLFFISVGMSMDISLLLHQPLLVFGIVAALLLLASQWFNPFAWRAIRAFRFDQEAACDARVLTMADEAPRDLRTARYATAIAKAAVGSPDIKNVSASMKSACLFKDTSPLSSRTRTNSALHCTSKSCIRLASFAASK